MLALRQRGLCPPPEPDKEALPPVKEDPWMNAVAVIGLGYWGPNLVRNLHQVAGPRLRVVCDRDPRRLEAIARQYPWLERTRDPQDVFRRRDIAAVVIATPVSTHFELARAAIQSGKSVLVEKPLVPSTAQAEELIDLAHRRSVVLMVDHVFVYSPAVQKIRQLVAQGELGQVRFIDSVRINLGLVQSDVNVLWDLAPHDLSIVDYVLDRFPESVAAYGKAHVLPGIEDVAYMTLDYGQGVVANFHLNWLSPVKIRYTIFGGTERSIVYNDLDPVEKVKVYDSGLSVQRLGAEDRRRVLVDYRTGDVWAPHLPKLEPLRQVVEHFLHCVDEGEAPLTDGLAALRVVRILEAAQESLRRDGERVSLGVRFASAASESLRPASPQSPGRARRSAACPDR